MTFVAISRNIHGAIVVTSIYGTRQYYYYTKREAMRKYREEFLLKGKKLDVYDNAH